MTSSNYQFAGKYTDRGTEQQASKPAVPNLFGNRVWFPGRQFFQGLVGAGAGGRGAWGGSRRRRRCGDSLGMIQGHYIYCAFYFYYYYTVIYNEIIIQLTIMQYQWEP